MGCGTSRADHSNDEFARLNRQSDPKSSGPGSSKISAHIPRTGPLSQEQYWSRLKIRPTRTLQLEGYRLRYAYISQRGFYPETPLKANQDAVDAKENFGGDPQTFFCAIYDGNISVDLGLLYVTLVKPMVSCRPWR